MDKRLVFSPEEGRSLWFPGQERPRALEKLAGEMHPEIAAWLRAWKPDPNFPVLVIAPMGASEYWGANSNGDWFGEDQLNPKSTRAYGHKTFENANLYSHHANKDPTVSRGRIALSVWNHRMHRAEVVAVYDRRRCMALGCSYLMEAIDQGRMFPVSMGTRVIYDICSVCGHRSRRTSEYCEHLRTMMGQALPDGTLVCAVNIEPKFFDLSDVYVEAAKESGVLAKVAQAARLPSQLVGFTQVGGAPRFHQHLTNQVKRAQQKAAATKFAEITKRVRSNVLRNIVDPLSGSEQSLSPVLLRRIASLSPNMDSSLATLGLGGVVLSPPEFSHLAHHHAGSHYPPPLAESGFPWQYPAGAAAAQPFAPDDILPRLVQAIRQALSSRSCHAHVVSIRVAAIPQSPCGMFPKVASMPSSDLREVLSREYGIYRSRLLASYKGPALAKLAAEAPQAVHPQALSRALRSGAGQPVVEEDHIRTLAERVVPVYLLGAHRDPATDPDVFIERFGSVADGVQGALHPGEEST